MSDQTLPTPSDMASTPLRSVASEYIDLADAIVAYAAEHDGIIPDDADDLLAEVEGALAVKLENCCKVVKNLGDNAALVKAEEARLRQLRQVAENAQRRLKEYMAHWMVKTGTQRSDGELLKVRTQANPPKAMVVDITKVPDEHKEVTVTMPASEFALLQHIIETHYREHGERREAFDPEKWTVTEHVRTKPIIDEWKASSGAYEVPGVVVDQTIGIRIW